MSWAEDVVLAILLEGLELDATARALQRGGQVGDAGDRLVLAAADGAPYCGRGQRLQVGDRQPHRDACPLVDVRGPRARRENSARISFMNSGIATGMSSDSP